ncbi:hypothetical protein [Vibrio comitans]|uniref:Uncharacterized protein n=1 Tax=Vibrio comitans NBRC 102076 TaxID=1219078 RepID=A0A4Y3ILJ0_9VIBR|nr:hypothetical protein [Vibrio comitans]GEA59862.1 hypothetical protein VCO01S_10550 [Vibrio comitans NBRC 102076]
MNIYFAGALTLASITTAVSTGIAIIQSRKAKKLNALREQQAYEHKKDPRTIELSRLRQQNRQVID